MAAEFISNDYWKQGAVAEKENAGFVDSGHASVAYLI
jgi:hypothetical protein